MASPSASKGWGRVRHLPIYLAIFVFCPVISALSVYYSLRNNFEGYDVFINFRGADVRSVFVSHLYDDLREKAIKPFMDVRDFEKGYRLEALLDKIEESKAVVMVFSENYAYSTFCLDELVKIMEFHAPRNTAMPVFYDVNRSDVTYQTGSFAEAFESLQQNATLAKRVPQWKAALKEAANMPGGRDSRSTSGGAEFVDLVVQDIMQVLEGIATSSKYWVGRQRLVLLLFCIFMALVCCLILPREKKYDVFVNYYGETTLARKLYDAFKIKGIKAFEDEGWERGTSMTSQIRRAIEESKVAVIIFSIGYASSPGCLDELVKIMERKEAGRLLIITEFFQVKPSDVRGLKGKFKQEFDIHPFRLAQRWRRTLSKAAETIPSELIERDEGNGFDIAETIAQSVKGKKDTLAKGNSMDKLPLFLFSLIISLVILAVWDPIIGERLERPFVQWKTSFWRCLQSIDISMASAQISEWNAVIGKRLMESHLKGWLDKVEWKKIYEFTVRSMYQAWNFFQ